MFRPIILGLVMVVACTFNPEGVNRPIPFERLLGIWSFHVQANPSCPGAATIGDITVFVDQTAQVCLDALCLGGSTRWSQVGSSKSGYVTGLLDLVLPGEGLFYLVEGDTANGGPPPPRKLARLDGTIMRDLTFAGTLQDGTADSSELPIFSTGSCTYQATGHH